MFPDEPGVFALAAGTFAGECAGGVDGDDAGAVVAAAAVFVLEDSMDGGVCGSG